MFVPPERIVKRAAEIRAQMGIAPTSPACPVEIAGKLGVQVRYLSLPSLEGIYRPGEPDAIVIGAQRPAGRRNFTCAHELGHHVYGHGYQIDEVSKEAGPRLGVEYIADRFAAALLMPKLAVARGFSVRGVDPKFPTVDAVAVVADELGVGYATLVKYMCDTLGLLDADTRRHLLRTTPKKRRVALLPMPTTGRMLVLDRFWRRSFVELEVGDVLLLPPASVVIGNAIMQSRTASLVEAIRPGRSAATIPGRADEIEIRVARKWFHGLDRYRFLEEIDDGE